MTTYGIEMIAAHRRGRVAPPLAPSSHSVGYYVDNFLDMIQLACARMLLRASMR